jgi:hypothetical protein
MHMSSKLNALSRDITGRFNRSVRRRGLFGTLKRAASRPWAIRTHRRIPVPDDNFDEVYNVDTGGIMPLANLNISSRNWIFGTFYGATNTDRFREMMAHLDFPLDDYTFVDFGSGKGKALLLAGQYPFKRVIGVEFAPELNEAARANLDSYTGLRASGPIDVVDGDATTYPIPTGPVVIYLCNPFSEEVMAGVVENIKAAATLDRPVYVLYFNPQATQSIEAAGFQVLAQRDQESPLKQAYAVYKAG